MLRSLALLTITGYQRWLSPRKGFSCAYRIQTGGRSCSAMGFRAISRFGFIKGMMLLRLRLARCAAVYRQQHPSPSFIKAQQGVCDAGCDLPCDVSDLHFGQALDFCDCCSCGDLGDWRQSRQEKRNTKTKPRRHHSL